MLVAGQHLARGGAQADRSTACALIWPTATPPSPTYASFLLLPKLAWPSTAMTGHFAIDRTNVIDALVLEQITGKR